VEDATEKRVDWEKIKNSAMQDQEIQATIRILKKEVPKWRVPVIGHYTESPFTVLISCLLSLRTQDKTTDAASNRLFQLARTPQAMAKLPTSVIEKTIYPVGFYKTKAKNIKKICRRLLSQDNGRVPDDIDTLLSLPGVGRKTANLVVTLGYQKPGICVDTHVHRITNRWGYVQTKQKLAQRYWIIINDLLVAYGQNLCKPISPFCSQCKISKYCDRVGVKVSR
jgi:endonuclease-3